jgi:inhibitor of cysteine peptidase
MVGADQYGKLEVKWNWNVIICLFMISCVPLHSRKMMQVDETFNGREVALHLGDMLEVRLSENPSTGYRWTQPQGFSSGWTTILKQVDDTFDSPASVPGRSGTRVLRFESIGTGDADLLMQYRRSWDKDAEPARSFRLHVRVQPSG